MQQLKEISSQVFRRVLDVHGGTELCLVPGYSAGTPLPILAGQAVASAVIETLGIDLNPVYNDFDVFEFSSHRLLNGSTSLKAVSTLTAEGVSLYYDGYSRLQAVTEGVYRVESSRTEGTLNRVSCASELQFRRSRRDFVTRVLRSFDLNCTQVGLDLTTGEMFWTREFEEFVRTRELRVASIGTPVHTAYRWFRKKKELGCYGNDDHAMETLIAAQELHARKNQGLLLQLRSRFLFGEKNRQKALEVEHELSRYFTLERQLPHWAVKLYTLVPRHQAGEDLLAFEGPAPLLPVFADASRGRWKRSVGSSIRQTLTQGSPSEVHAVFVKGPKALEPENRAEALSQKKLFRQHPLFGHVYSRGVGEMLDGLSLAVQRAEKAQGPWVYGVFEGGSLPIDLLSGSADTPPEGVLLEAGVSWKSMSRAEQLGALVSQLGAEQVVERLLAVYQDKVKSLFAAKEASRFITPVTFKGVELTELRSPEELAQEGKEMGHCVGGYTLNVLEGASCIVRVRSQWGDPRLTLELTGGLKFKRIVQLKGPFNRDPSLEMLKFCDNYCDALNLQLLLRRAGLRVSTQSSLQACAAAPWLRKLLGLPVTLQRARRSLSHQVWRFRFWVRNSRALRLLRSNNKNALGVWDEIPF